VQHKEAAPLRQGNREVELIVLADHLHICVAQAVKENDGEAAIKEMIEVLAKCCGHRLAGVPLKTCPRCVSTTLVSQRTRCPIISLIRNATL
jgi:hypothetical protein